MTRVIIGMWVVVMVFAIPSAVFRDVREDTAEKKQTRLVCAPNHTLPRHVSILVVQLFLLFQFFFFFGLISFSLIVLFMSPKM